MFCCHKFQTLFSADTEHNIKLLWSAVHVDEALFTVPVWRIRSNVMKFQQDGRDRAISVYR